MTGPRAIPEHPRGSGRRVLAFVAVLFAAVASVPVHGEGFVETTESPRLAAVRVFLDHVLTKGATAGAGRKPLCSPTV